MRLPLFDKEYNKFAEEKSLSQRSVGGMTKGSAVTYMLSDGKKIQKLTERGDGDRLGGESREFSA